MGADEHAAGGSVLLLRRRRCLVSLLLLLPLQSHTAGALANRGSASSGSASSAVLHLLGGLLTCWFVLVASKFGQAAGAGTASR